MGRRERRDPSPPRGSGPRNDTESAKPEPGCPRAELLAVRARCADHLEPSVGQLRAHTRERLDEHVDPFDRVQLSQVEDGRRRRPRHVAGNGKLQRRRQIGAGAPGRRLAPGTPSARSPTGRGTRPPRAPSAAPTASGRRALRRRDRVPSSPAAFRAPAARTARRARRAARAASTLGGRVDVEEENRVEILHVIPKPAPQSRAAAARSSAASRCETFGKRITCAPVRLARRSGRDSRVEIENVGGRDRDLVPGLERAADGRHGDRHGAAECSGGREPGDTHEQPHSE